MKSVGSRKWAQMSEERSRAGELGEEEEPAEVAEGRGQWGRRGIKGTGVLRAGDGVPGQSAVHRLQ